MEEEEGGGIWLGSPAHPSCRVHWSNVSVHYAPRALRRRLMWAKEEIRHFSLSSAPFLRGTGNLLKKIEKMPRWSTRLPQWLFGSEAKLIADVGSLEAIHRRVLCHILLSGDGSHDWPSILPLIVTTSGPGCHFLLFLLIEWCLTHIKP